MKQPSFQIGIKYFILNTNGNRICHFNSMVVTNFAEQNQKHNYEFLAILSMMS